jgi:PAS domain S-box-containing protein
MRFVTRPRPPEAETSALPDVRPPSQSALIVVLIYVGLAVLWLAFAGRLVASLPPGAATGASDAAPWLFVVVSALGLFFGLRFELGRRAARIGELHRAHQRLRRHVHGTPLAVIELDGDTKVRHWSFGAEDLFGWSAEEVKGLRWTDWDLVHPEEREPLSRFLAELRTRSPGGALLVQRNRHRNGEEVWCEWYTSWTRDAKDNLTSLFCLVNDITPDREAMERMQDRNRELEVRVTRRTRELAQVRRDLRAFTDSLAHDLRGPVRAVIGFAEDLRTEIADNLAPEARRKLVYLTAAGRQLDHLIRDLLEYARLGDHKVVRRPLEVTEVLRAVIRDLEENFPEAASVVSVPRGAVSVPADPELLSRVLRNVLENALQYRDPHRPPRVSVLVTDADSEVKIRVQDNGTGIPAEQRERVFRLFERLHSRESHPGSGMGLSIVRKAMDLMGGTVMIEESSGPGATVLLRFPTEGDALARLLEEPGAERDGEPAQEPTPPSSVTTSAP